MLFALDPVAMPAGYGEAVLPLADAKAHCRVLDDDEDDLIAALRDAAVQMVEHYCGVRLTDIGGSPPLVWRGETLPSGATPVEMGVRPITAIVSLAYADASGAAQTIAPAALRIVRGEAIAPAIGASWPADVGGSVVISFRAAMDAPPPVLISAAKMFLATLFIQRESLSLTGAVSDVPHGFAMLCRPYRRQRV